MCLDVNCRLASVQDKRQVSMPFVATKPDVTDNDRKMLLGSIQAIVPDHTARLRSLEVSGNLSLLRISSFLDIFFSNPILGLFCSIQFRHLHAPANEHHVGSHDEKCYNNKVHTWKKQRLINYFWNFNGGCKIWQRTDLDKVGWE